MVGDTAMTGRPEPAGAAGLRRGGKKRNAVGISREAITIMVLARTLDTMQSRQGRMSNMRSYDICSLREGARSRICLAF